ncbi:MAG: OmpA family protein [Candidatus Krumholzibacteriota bacterium]|nr:OmpA family protein [Candidatus Krumholzibacteriota bacterium]
MKRMTASLLVLTLIVGVFGVYGCTWSSSQKGTAIGTAAGAVIGAAIGKKTGNTALGTILGATIGGAAGMYIGNYMDKQAEEIERDLEGAKVERVGEGIKITFDSGILFDVDRAALQPAAKTDLERLAVILNKYSDTNILIEGHTDSTGSEEHNMELSRKRAEAVAAQLAAVSVDPVRFTLVGYGEIQPIATNDTELGRKQNRRVELAIMANDKLKKVAEEKSSG